MRMDNSTDKNHTVLRIENGGRRNETIEREEHLVLRVDNGDIEKVGHSENERIGKVQIEACMRIENIHEMFDPI